MTAGGGETGTESFFLGGLLQEFMKKLEEKRGALTKATSMGEAILTICHPDSITTIKHWNTIIKARFEEVSAPPAGRSGLQQTLLAFCSAW